MVWPSSSCRMKLRLPCSTPVAPPVIDDACRPVSIALAAGLQAEQLDSGSSRKAWKIPIAFEPPPTQAATTSGSRPTSSSTWARASSPMTLWKSRTIVGNGCGPATVPIR